MVDLGKKQNRSAFKKRAHRPWKSSLLEQTIEETAIELENSLFEFDIDLDLETNQSSDVFYPESDFSEAIITAPVNKAEPTAPIEPKIEEQPDTQITNKLLLGGFFKTQQRISQANLEASRKINALLTDLKKREHNTEANEARVRQAIEQSDIISEQFHTAMEQAKQAALAHEQEAALRRAAELQVKEAQLQTNNAQIELQNERQLRMAAEQQAQQALIAAAAAEDLKQQLHDVIDKLMHTELEKNSIEQRHLEIQQQIAAATAQHDKLKNIIKAEQELRKIVEQQLAETGWQFNQQTIASAVKPEVVEAYHYEPDDLNY